MDKGARTVGMYCLTEFVPCKEEIISIHSTGRLREVEHLARIVMQLYFYEVVIYRMIYSHQFKEDFFSLQRSP